MAVNQSHTENRRGAVVAYGESILQQCHDVDLSFPQHPEGSNLFSGTKQGTLFLTSYRVIFVTSHSVSDPMLSFMMPFDLMSNCAIKQPVFAANYIKGTIQAAPDGGWEGQATFKLVFRTGGAIRFFQLMMRAASAAAQGVPLQSVGLWFTSPGLFFATGQRNMIYHQQMPCPVVVFGSPLVQYGTPPARYRTPPAGDRTPPAAYEALPVGYVAPPPGYGAPPAGHGTPPVRNEVPAPRHEASLGRHRAGSHNSVAAQPDRYEAPPPSTSPSQAHTPPSKK